jgi:hypothetical protein
MFDKKIQTDSSQKPFDKIEVCVELKSKITATTETATLKTFHIFKPI